MHLNLVDAFAKFGAKPANRLRGLSAIAADGSLVLSCSHACFGHPAQGVLRYEDKLSRAADESRNAALLGQHLTKARDDALPVRMIVMTAIMDARTSKLTRSFHVRPDLIGKIVKFDGDHLIVDFTRLAEGADVAAQRK
ncbi:MAG TPA: hypothetical protein VIY54_10290 [Steroidobacteraceae bacterium]